MASITDILGGSAASADPDAIRRVAARLDDISTTANSIRQNLRALEPSNWTGTAAEAYREKQNNDIPRDIDKVTSSFGIASRALTGYASELNSILDQARSLASQLDVANEDLASAHSGERQAVSNLRDARLMRASATDPVAAAQADRHVQRAAYGVSSAVAHREGAEENVARLEGQGRALSDELQACAGSCVAQLHDASHAGIGNTVFSAFDRHVVDGVVGATVSDAAAIVSSTVSEAEKGLDTAAKWWSGFVERHGGLINDIALGVAVVTIAVLAVATDGAGLAFAPSILGATSKLGLALDGSKEAADVWLASRGEGNWSTVEGDSVSVGFDLIPFDKLGPADKLTGATQVEKMADHFGSSLDDWAKTGSSDTLHSIWTQVDAFKRPIAKYVVLDTGIDIASSKVSDKLKNVVTDAAHTLLGPLDQTPEPGLIPGLILPGLPVNPLAPMPFIGPFPGLLQGANSSIRTFVGSHSTIAQEMAL